MCETDILYESIVPSRGFPLCLSAQLVQPSDNKTTSVSLDVALLLGTPAHAQESLACF